MSNMAKPQVVSKEEWDTRRAELLQDEKEATRILDKLAAKRRRLPMTKFSIDYTFDTPDGPQTFLDLFQGRQQLAQYQFMDRGATEYCPGCTGLMNNVPEHALALLAKRGISWVTISNMPLTQIEEYKAKQGWTMPFVSSHSTPFTDDIGAGGGFQFNMFLRDGDDVYRTYSTTRRGTDRMLFMHWVLDNSVFGRQEEWEDSPEGWPQRPTYGSEGGL